MGNNLFVLGLSWRTAPVELRERLAFRDEELPDVLREVLGADGVGEAMLVSTCNRVEFYGATSPTAPNSSVSTATAALRHYLAARRGVSSEELSEIVYEHTEEEAVRHVFRVASSLDSLVVGEAQILGQVKSAFGAAAEAGATGPLLGRCVEKAFAVAKRVRSETGISRGAANVSSVAVELATRVFGDLYGKTVLLVGAGKMSDLAARHLRADGAGGIIVTNRSPEKAAALAERVDGVPRPWEDLDSALAVADVVITSTGATEPVLDKKRLKKVMKARKYRSLVIIDIAVPRDVEAAVGSIDGVYLFDIDDLQRVVAENLKLRAREASEAVHLVEGEVEKFSRWMRSQSVVPTIRALRQRFSDVARAEAEKVARNLRTIDDPDKREQTVRRLGDLIVNKLLHQPMNALKNQDGGDSEALVEAARELFGLDEAREIDDVNSVAGTKLEPSPARDKSR